MASTGVTRSSSYNNLQQRNFIPEIWSMTMQKKFYAMAVVPAITNRDWEGEIKGAGSVVHIRIVPTVPVDDYVVGQDLSYSDLEDEKLTLNIDKAKTFSFQCDDVDKAQMDINVMQKATKDAQKGMKIQVDVDVLSGIHASATTDIASVQWTKVNILDEIVDIRTELDQLNVPKEGRFGVLAPAFFGLISKSDLKDASLSGDDTSIVRKNSNFVGNIAGFDLLESNLLPGASTSASPRHCLFGTRDATTFAQQLMKYQAIPVLQNTFGSAYRGLQVYGYQVVKADALVDANVWI